MILLNDFYYIRSFDADDKTINAELEFNTEHDIFKGHFPAVPVVPGVCMMQIIQEMVEKLTMSAKRISNVQQMKFLTLINPAITPGVHLSLSFTTTPGEVLQVTASLLNDTVTYFKFRGEFVNEQSLSH